MERAGRLHRRGTAAALDHRSQDAVKLLRRALALLPADRSAGPAEHALRYRVTMSLAYPVAELSGVDDALRMLADAGAAAADLDGVGFPGLIHNQRGLVLLRHGRLVEAVDEFAAGAGLLDPEHQAEDLVAVLVNRGVANLELHDPAAARQDFEVAVDVALRDGGLDLEVAMTLHNLGYVSYLIGDLPRALKQMEDAAAKLGPSDDGPRAVSHLDRARALTAAGLLTEAAAELDAAAELFGRLRSPRDRAETMLARADVALLAGDYARAATIARRAARDFRRRQNLRWAMLAELTGAEADLATGRRPLRTAAVAHELANRLTAAELPVDARLARLIAAQATLAAGRDAAIPRVLTTDRLGTRLAVRLVRARAAERRGDTSARESELRKGLADLHHHRVRYGSADMQAAVAVHGRRIMEAGLAGALRDGRPSVVHGWVERTRATSLRLQAVAPPEDQEAAALLAELRSVRSAVRFAELSGRADAALAAHRTRLEHRVRQHDWEVAGTSSELDRSARLGAVRDALAERDGCLLSYLVVDGGLHAVVAARRSARVVPLGPIADVLGVARRVRADLDALTLTVLPAPVRHVVRGSLAAGLARLDELLWRPLHAGSGNGPVLLVPTGALTTIPWGGLAGLAARPVAVVPSATWWLSRRGRPATGSGRPVFAAGPGLARAEDEVRMAAACWGGATALTGSAATVPAVLTAATGAGLLHLAAHGRHEPDNPLFSAVELADGPMFGYDLPHATRLPPHVVLSACDLGLAVVRPGDEPLGMTAALLHAGVRTVVASVARVGDQAACDAMVGYHRALHSGRAPAEALLDAHSAAGAGPAPFVCFGAGW